MKIFMKNFLQQTKEIFVESRAPLATTTTTTMPLRVAPEDMLDDASPLSPLAAPDLTLFNASQDAALPPFDGGLSSNGAPFNDVPFSMVSPLDDPSGRYSDDG